MPIRHFADINQTSDSFGGGTNAGMNRHEEFRQERNREFHSQPRKDPNEAARQSVREHDAYMANVMRSKKLYSTSEAGTPVHFENRVFVLPPTRGQTLDTIGEARVIDSQLGGLGFRQHMYDFFVKTMDETMASNRKISQSNAALANKKSFGLFGKKERKMVAPAYITPTQHVIDDFNKGLAAQKIPVFVAVEDGLTFVYHPSSLSGDPKQELHDWKSAHWDASPQRPWDSFLLERLATLKAS